MASRLRLPSTVTEWRGVVRAALHLPTASVKLPPHFNVIRSDTSEVYSFAKMLPPVEHQSEARESGVLVALMPNAAQGAPVTGAGQPAVRHDPKDAEPLGAERVAADTPIAFDGMDLVVPLTLRTAKLRSHSGQISFPGGRCDAGETPEVAAQREATEEIGMEREAFEVLGRTQRVYSYPSKSFVYPVVAFADTVQPLHRASPDEVESVHYVSLAALLLDPTRQHHRINRTWSSTGPMRMPAFHTTDGQLVWGLTCFVLCELLARIGTVLHESHNVPLMRMPPAVLRAWGDTQAVGQESDAYVNPYEDPVKQPLTRGERRAHNAKL